MDTLALDEIVPLKGSSVSIGAENTFRPSFRVADTDGADTALALVSEAGQAIRKLEKDSKEAVVRAHDAAMAVKTRLDQTVTRVEQAEAALRKAESEIDNLLDMVARANEEIENVRSLFADKERELVEMTERAVSAEERAKDAANAVQRIVAAIRTEIPIVPSMVGSASV